MMREERQGKHAGGRPKKTVKRTRVTGVRFNNLEYLLVKNRALRAGIGITVYLRQMALEGEVKARLSDDDRQLVRQLAGMANNLNQLAKMGHQQGCLPVALEFKKYTCSIDTILERLKI